MLLGKSLAQQSELILASSLSVTRLAQGTSAHSHNYSFPASPSNIVQCRLWPEDSHVTHLPRTLATCPPFATPKRTWLSEYFLCDCSDTSRHQLGASTKSVSTGWRDGAVMTLPGVVTGSHPQGPCKQRNPVSLPPSEELHPVRIRSCAHAGLALTVYET